MRKHIRIVIGVVLVVASVSAYYWSLPRKPEISPTSPEKPVIPASSLDLHAGIVNKHAYQKDDLVREMEKQLGTSFSSQHEILALDRQDREALDRAANLTSMGRFILKFDDLKKEMDGELKELSDLMVLYRANQRLRGLVDDQQAARDRVAGIMAAISEKMYSD